MEENLGQSGADDSPLGMLAEMLAEGRRRARGALAAQRQRFEQLEAEMAEHIQAIADELARERQHVGTQQEEIDERRKAFESQHIQFEQLQATLESAQQQLAEQSQAHHETLCKLHSESEALKARSRQFEESEEQFTFKRQRLARRLIRIRAQHRKQTAEKSVAEQRHSTAIANDQQQLQTLHEQVASLQLAAENLRAELNAQRELADHLRDQLKAQLTQTHELAQAHGLSAAQRQRLAQRLFRLRTLHRQQMAEKLAAEQLLSAAIAGEQQQVRAFEQQLADSRLVANNLRAELKTEQELTHKLGEQLAELGRERSEETQQTLALRKRYQRLLVKAKQLQTTVTRQEEQLTSASQTDTRPVVERLERENQGLAERAILLEEQLKAESSPEAKQRLTDLQRRFEMAVEDVRELKIRCKELEQQLSEANSNSSKRMTAANENLDWESQKRRLLEALEEDITNDSSEAAQANRLTIEGTIQITDEVVAEKDREIADLKNLLQDQSSNLHGLARGAAGIAEVLDSDALILEERQRLEHLKAEWEEKLRQAEIDISLQRAKIARERLAIEDKTQALETKLASHRDAHAAGIDNKPGKPMRRWLSMLGIKENDDDPPPETKGRKK